jgi:hypothetical protein
MRPTVEGLTAVTCANVRVLRHHPAQNLVGQVVDGPGITSTTWPQPLEFLTPPRNIAGMLRSIRALEGAATSAV